MKNALRNRSFRRHLSLAVLLSLLFVVLSFWLDPLFGILTLIACATLCLVFWHNAASRYRAIARLSADIDRILHDPSRSLLTDSEEGELSILYSEIRKMTNRLLEARRALLADKQQLSDAIADISHQLRTPLTAITLQAAALGRDFLPDAERLKMAQELKQTLEREKWLIEALLKLSRLDSGTVRVRRTTVSVAPWIRRVVEPYLLWADLHDVTLHYDIAPDCTFFGDAEWTAEAIGNLVKNALEHAPQGGNIWLQARQTPLFTALLIADDGPGIAPEDLPHLFDRFYRGRHVARQSIGIGLALCRRILAEEDATVEAANRSEGGARFTVRFYGK